MRRTLFCFVCTMILSGLSHAQQIQHKIVFDFTKGDTASFATIIRQATNLCNVTQARLEIVCHGPGLDMIMKEKTTVQKEIENLEKKCNVVFGACEATMKRRGVDNNQLVPQVIVVPLANLELSSKQQEGWSYIKFGQ